MSYLIDTNVIFELARAKPDPRVVEWFNTIPDSALYLSVLTLGELRKRVEKMPDANRREKLRLWLENDLPAWFGDHLLPVNAAIADRWGRLQSETTRPLPSADSLLTATALHHDLRIVTCNDKDFEVPGLVVVNPWKD
ncbi:PilT protein-like protein [Sulfuricella denitrificans skB26]|uniref:Ribonuclease VapC n=1 Tax=Sulfuricella denitrificans (strain DSM 22764 / NBRC 105220 / skB26) TaxID=1163617 RepID=S6AHE9_SULDS|nr:type II toxin-antitoxin system VapC family toxin [Sulfuricella denitrificans]BAN33914.1 PilT protein-like protein [Sulfuricella denitrificans skB26]